MNQNKNPNTTFIALELSLDLVRTVRPLVDRIARTLADRVIAMVWRLKTGTRRA